MVYGIRDAAAVPLSLIAELMYLSICVHVGADAPVITFQGRFNPLIVVESSSVTLRCLVDANPPVHPDNVRWLRSGIEQGSYLGSIPREQFPRNSLVRHLRNTLATFA